MVKVGTAEGRARRRLAAVVSVATLAAGAVVGAAGPAWAQEPEATPIDAPDLRLPAGMVALADGSVLIADLMTSNVLRLAEPGGTAAPVAAPAAIGLAAGLAVDGAGTIHLGTEASVGGGSRVPALATARLGDTTTSYLPLPEVPNAILGLAVSRGGEVVLATGGPQVRALAPGATATRPLPLTGVQGAFDVAFTADGSLLVSDADRGAVLRFVPGATTPTVLPFTGLSSPAQLEVDRFGSIYVADGGDNNRVLRLAPGSRVAEVLPFPATDGVFPAGVAVTPRGDVYVGYPYGSQVLRLSAEAETERLARYVDRLYQGILGRGSDASGRAFHAGRLFEGAAPEAVSLGLARSTEARARLVAEMYRAILGRAPDAAGSAYWVGRLAGGTPPDAVGASLASSAEIRTRHPSSEAFVAALYRGALGRSADGDPGAAHWVERLDGGTARATVARSVLTSAEAVNRQVRARYLAVLDRAPTADELAAGRAAWPGLGRDPMRLAAELAATSELLNG